MENKPEYVIDDEKPRKADLNKLGDGSQVTAAINAAVIHTKPRLEGEPMSMARPREIKLLRRYFLIALDFLEPHMGYLDWLKGEPIKVHTYKQARKYNTHKGATDALDRARKLQLFLDARIIEVTK
jgi:hypothetical protein